MLYRPTAPRTLQAGIIRRRALLIILTALCSCGRKRTRVAVVPREKATQQRLSTPPPPIGTTETGIASWYGHPYHGRQAANGEIYDMEKMTAAHRTLPFSTWVRVNNLTNGKSVEVRITDRGPFVGNRIIDLSHAAARELDMIGPGTANVRVVVIANPAAPEPGVFAVQVGLFRDHVNAGRLRDKLAALYGTSQVLEREGSPTLYRVTAGALATEAEAQALAAIIRRDISVPEAYVVRLDPQVH